MRHSVVGFGSGYRGATSGSSFDPRYDGLGAGALVGSTADTVWGSAAHWAASAAHFAGSAAGTGVAVGPGVPVGQSGQLGQSDIAPITLSDVFSAGSVEGAAHLIASSQLLHNVSGLPANQIVNVTRTLGGDKEFTLKDWVQIGDACQAGQFDAALLDSADNVVAMFTSKGENYVKAKNGSGTMVWAKAKLNYSGTMAWPALKVKEVSQHGFEEPEEPEVTAARLESIARAAKTQISGSRLMGTDRAYKDLALPSVSGNGDLKFVKASSYTGVTAPIPGSLYMIVGAKLIGQGVSSSANIGNNISLPSSL